MPTPEARKERVNERRWVAASLLILFIAALFWVPYQGRTELRDSQIAGCQRGKLDRAANARAFRAQADYLDLVLAASSVQQDVKTAARINQAQQDISARGLESRTGKNLDCDKVFPHPTLLP